MERYEEVLIALRRIIRAVDLHSKKLMQISGLTGPQLMVLLAIGPEDAMTAGNLARSVSLSQGTVTSILDRMEKRGYVQRTRDQEDKRKVLISLSLEGREALDAAPRPLQESFIEAFQGLSDWEQNLLLSSLQRVAEMMDAQHLDVAPLLETQPLDASMSET